jgi:hypothetical protein
MLKSREHASENIFIGTATHSPLPKYTCCSYRPYGDDNFQSQVKLHLCTPWRRGGEWRSSPTHCNLGNRTWLVSFMARALYFRVKIPQQPLNKGWAGTRGGLDGMEGRKFYPTRNRTAIPRLSSLYPSSLPTELSWFLMVTYICWINVYCFYCWYTEGGGVPLLAVRPEAPLIFGDIPRVLHGQSLSELSTTLTKTAYIRQINRVRRLKIHFRCVQVSCYLPVSFSIFSVPPFNRSRPRHPPPPHSILYKLS